MIHKGSPNPGSANSVVSARHRLHNSLKLFQLNDFKDLRLNSVKKLVFYKEKANKMYKNLTLNQPGLPKRNMNNTPASSLILRVIIMYFWLFAFHLTTSVSSFSD